MKRLTLTLALVLLIAALMPALATQSPEGRMTVMVYMVGSDLESRWGVATLDIEEMIHSEYDADEVNVILMCGGARHWHLGLSGEETSIVQPSSRGVRTLWSAPAMNMGDPGTLSFFLDYAVEHYPASSYGLVLWGHGYSNAGFGYDEVFQNDAMALPELDEALSNSLFSKEQLEWIIFDASYMGNLEVGMTCAPYARYMIADELSMPSTGLDHSFLKDLNANADTEAFGRAVLDLYLASKPENSDNDIAACCVYLNALGEVSRARDTLLATLDSVLGSDADELRGIFNSTMLVEASIGDRSDHLCDLALLAKRCAQYAPEETVALTEALGRTVICSVGTVEGAAGLSTCVQNEISY